MLLPVFFITIRGTGNILQVFPCAYALEFLEYRLRHVTAGLQDIHIFNLIRFCQIALQSVGANLHLD